MSIEQLLVERAKMVDEELARLTLEIKPRELAQAVAYAISSKGKRIRPALVTLASEAVGGSAEDTCFAAASIELIHSSSLVLDDVIDKSEKRRGRYTIHTLWGNDMALLTVQILASLSLKIAARDPRLINAIADCLFYMGEGEAMELVEFAKDKDTYLDLAFCKTGSLFGSAAEVGSVVGGGTRKQIRDLTKYGHHLGIAFQIRDDILDCISKEEDLGKPVRRDLFMERPSIVILDALNRGITLERMMKCNNGELMDLVTDSLDFAKGVAKEQIAVAKAYAGGLEDSWARDRLMELCDHIVNRSK